MAKNVKKSQKKTVLGKKAKTTSATAGITPQNSGDYEVGYKKPPQTQASKATRYGGERENRRGHGFFSAKDTPRAKLEKIITLPDDDLIKVRDGKTSSRFERNIAEILLAPNLKPAEKWRILKEMIDEVYGTPKIIQENHNVNYKPLVDLTKRKKNGSDDGAK